MEGGVPTVKLTSLATVPPGAATVITPVVAAAGTTAVSSVFETTLMVVATFPLKVTCVVPVSPPPAIVTVVPTGPPSGEKPLIYVPMMNGSGLIVVPPDGVVIVMGPVVAPDGTVATISFADLT